MQYYELNSIMNQFRKDENISPICDVRRSERANVMCKMLFCVCVCVCGCCLCSFCFGRPSCIVVEKKEQRLEKSLAGRDARMFLRTLATKASVVRFRCFFSFACKNLALLSFLVLVDLTLFSTFNSSPFFSSNTSLVVEQVSSTSSL